MDVTTTTTTAALRSRSESSFMVPTGAEASWHLAVAYRTNAKQAGPPRGVPR